MRFLRLLTTTLIALVLLAACSFPDLPGAPQMPQPPSPRSLPGVNDLLDQLPGFDLDLLRELELPDLSEIANLPQLGDLPGLPVPENAIAFVGPTEMRIDVGDSIRGTDIQLTGIVDGRAEFLFSGLRAERIAGDSLDFDGPWPNISSVDYMLRPARLSGGGRVRPRRRCSSHCDKGHPAHTSTNHDLAGDTSQNHIHWFSRQGRPPQGNNLRFCRN